MMCYKLKCKYVLACLVIFTHASFAQQVSCPAARFTLQQVWEQAEQYNKSIQMQQLHVQSSDEDIKDAKAERLPEFNIEGEYARVSNVPVYVSGLFKAPEYIPVIHKYYRAGADAYLNLYNGNKTNIKIAEQQTVKQLREEQKNLTVSQVKVRAAAYFLDLHQSNAYRLLMLNNIAEQEKQLQRIRELQKRGVILKSDVLRAELQLSQQRLALTRINNDITIANQKLDILMGQPDSLVIMPTGIISPDSLTAKSYDDYLADALNKSYQNKISEQETNLRRLQLKDIKANVLPRIGLFANYAYTYPQIQFYPYEAALYGLGMAGIRATIPISALYHNKHKVKASELEYKLQELEHQDTQDVIRQQVNEAYLRYQEALNRISVAQTNIQQATENSRIVNNTYFNQLSLVTDLLEANTQLMQTRFELVSAQTAALIQYYQLQQVTGNL